MLQEVWNFYGSKAATARALGITSACVSQWIDKNSIPPRKGVIIERQTLGKYRAVYLAGEIVGEG